MRNISKILAFTLAETLVVMGIIGVVAALTIPNLNQSTGDKEKVAKVKKAYANLNDALGRAIATYGAVDRWFLNDGYTTEEKAKHFGERISEFLKVSKVCEDGASPCFSSEDYDNAINNPKGNKLIHGTPANYPTETYNVLLADGTAVSFNFNSKNIVIDIDGSKGKNQTNADLFAFEIVDGDLMPYGYNTDTCVGKLMNIAPGLDRASPAGDCTNWVITHGNMDYLKTTNGVCPNGTILDGVNNTTCR